ncbi:hypothetical protein GCM10027160_01530 [Streptomyces calidiresistens]
MPPLFPHGHGSRHGEEGRARGCRAGRAREARSERIRKVDRAPVGMTRNHHQPIKVRGSASASARVPRPAAGTRGPIPEGARYGVPQAVRPGRARRGTAVRAPPGKGRVPGTVEAVSGRPGRRVDGGMREPRRPGRGGGVLAVTRPGGPCGQRIQGNRPTGATRAQMRPRPQVSPARVEARTNITAA